MACPEEVHEAELFEGSQRANRPLLRLRGATRECRESQGMTEGDSRSISIRVHRTVPRHPVVSTSNAESVEAGEDASELNRLREPARSRRSSLFTGSTSSQRAIQTVRDAFAHEDMDDTETMTLTRWRSRIRKKTRQPTSPTISTGRSHPALLTLFSPLPLFFSPLPFFLSSPFLSPFVHFSPPLHFFPPLPFSSLVPPSPFSPPLPFHPSPCFSLSLVFLPSPFFFLPSPFFVSSLPFYFSSLFFSLPLPFFSPSLFISSLSFILPFSPPFSLFPPFSILFLLSPFVSPPFPLPCLSLVLFLMRGATCLSPQRAQQSVPRHVPDESRLVHA